MSAQPASDAYTAKPTDELIELADHGDEQAAAELDRRGVEPPVLDIDHTDLPSADITSLDAAREKKPSPHWLRQLASTLKFESAMIAGHQETLVEEIVAAAGDGDLEQPVRRAMLHVQASACMTLAAGALVDLAEALDERPIDDVRAAMREDPRGERDR